MKFFSNLICLTWVVFTSFNSYGLTKLQLPLHTTDEFESVWLWQIDTPYRKIYIAGEQHNHALLPNEILSHRLASTAYELSSRVLIENIDTEWLGKDQLKTRLTASTWASLDAAVRKSVAIKLTTKKDLSVAQRNVPLNDIVEVVNRMQDGKLFLALPGMLQPAPEIENQLRLEIGYIRKIILDSSKDKTAKHETLETSDAANKIWSKYCGLSSDAELLVLEILTETGLNAELSEKKLQQEANEFRSSNATTESMTQRIKNSAYWDIANKCSVRPRNLEWIKKILQEISTDKQPLMVVVGIGHVIGNTGLLSLLCKEGYCQSKRVKLTDLVKKQ